MNEVEAEKPKLNDWIAKGYTPVNTEQLVYDNDWSRFLPIAEYQDLGGYDRSACGAYLVTNLIEILHLKLTGKEINLSDRSLAKMGGVDIKKGGWLQQIFDEGRNNGFNYEHDWPDTLIKEDYYKDIPQDVLDKRVKFEIYREWVPTYNRDLIFNSLNYAPLGVLCRYANGDEILNPEGKYNHFVTIYGAEKGKYWKIFDHYTNNKKKYAWDYEFGCVLKPTLILKDTKPYMKNNTLVQLVQGEGGFGLFLDDKIIVDDAAKILASFVVRNNGDIKGMVKPLALIDWNKYEKTNLKGEYVSKNN